MNTEKDSKSLVEELQDKIALAQTEVRKQAQSSILDMLKILFDKYPIVKSVSFVAFTPYFNDGEECIYSTTAGSCDFNGYVGGDVKVAPDNIRLRSRKKWWTRETGYIDHKHYDAECEEACFAFDAIIGAIKSDTWKFVVGDHVKVTITAESITTESYDDHD